MEMSRNFGKWRNTCLMNLMGEGCFGNEILSLRGTKRNCLTGILFISFRSIKIKKILN